MEQIEVMEIDGRRWVTVADAAREVGKPEITLYKAREANRLPSRIVYGRVVVDLDVARELYPQAASDG